MRVLALNGCRDTLSETIIKTLECVDMKKSGAGVNNTSVREENRRRVAYLLYRQGGLSKQAIARQLGLSIPTVNLLVSQLKDEGMLMLQSGTSTGGRIPEIAHFRYDSQYVFGMEVTDHHLRIVLIDLAGVPLFHAYYDLTFRKEQSYWLEARSLLYSIMKQRGLTPANILGVGIAIPGVVRQDHHQVDFAPTLDLRRFDYRMIEDIFTLPVIVENEANAAGFAESWLHGRDQDDGIYLSVNKGVGGAVIVDHALSYGINRRSGEFGHMTLVPHGRRCSCGKEGCFEAYCSTQVLSALTGGDLSEFFRRKGQEPEFQTAWETYLSYLAQAVSNICVSLDVPVVIGGDIAPYLENDFQIFTDMVRELIPFSSDRTYISLSNTGADAACIGAALLLVARRLDLLPLT